MGINNLKPIRKNHNCFYCRFALEEKDLAGRDQNGRVVCLACSLEKIQLRLSVLNDWLFEKKRLQKDIKKYLDTNQKAQTKYALRELEK